MRFSIRYRSDYDYSQPVADNLNSLRVRPGDSGHQRCESFLLRVDPHAHICARHDYFGTDVQDLGVFVPHERLSIEATSVAVTRQPAAPQDGAWEQLRVPAYRAHAGDMLLPWQDRPALEGLSDLIAEVIAATPLQTLQLLCEVIPSSFEYRPGATYVGSTTADLLHTKAGVCQDFVQLSLLMLRRLGIGARYVSGYLWAASEHGGSDSVEVNTHAWLEALMPDAESGRPQWIGVDPTNRTLAGEMHVKIGHGRFYDDVPPVRGIYRGGGNASLHAAVHMTRDQGADPGDPAYGQALQ